MLDRGRAQRDGRLTVAGQPPVAAASADHRTFTGRVWADPALVSEASVMVNNVFFEPGARTHWHRHEVAQVLHVTGGEGWLQTRAGDGGPLTTGDTAHIPGGEEHWHGAAPDSYMAHLAISVGASGWLDPVSDEDYTAAFRGDERA